MRRYALGWLLGAAVWFGGPGHVRVRAEEPGDAAARAAREKKPAQLTPERFDGVLRLIKPQEGELRFQEIPWLLSVHEARKRAAAEGKPILVWSGSGGAPLGVC